jgi:hypothetical protein
MTWLAKIGQKRYGQQFARFQCTVLRFKQSTEQNQQILISLLIGKYDIG